MQHTPGPWNVNELGIYHDAYPIALVMTGSENPQNHWIDGNPIGKERAHANARLIAAAPDLLAVCQKCEASLIEARFYVPLSETQKAFLAELQAAIAKATGQQPT